MSKKVSLEKYLTKIIKLNDRHIKAKDLLRDEAIKLQRKADEDKQLLRDEAIKLQRENDEKWRIAMNEWRGAMSDKDKTYATKETVEELKRNIFEREGVRKFITWGLAILIGIIGIITFYINFSK